MDKEVTHLQNPDKLALNNAYRSMPRYGEIKLFISVNNLTDTLRSMESAGFVGIEIIHLNSSSESANIRAYKAKNGPCYDTGRFVVYDGAALAALDDDNHLLFKGKQTPVCEKTANIYKLPAYEKLVRASDPDPILLAKLRDQPVIFNCDTFESDNTQLFQMVKEPGAESELVDLIYPGPFRLLIMEDGRIIHRGQTTRVPKSDVSGLIEKDRLFRNGNESPGQPLFFKEIYRLYGTGCLLDKKIIPELIEKEVTTDFNILKKISDELKEHILNLIRDNKKYFILTGSDTEDKLGCCPSEIITEANRLKRAGILDSFQQSVPDESCPLTIYAFKDEIKINDNDLQFRINDPFRKLVFKNLQNNTGDRFRFYAKWILLAFIAVTLTIAILKLSGSLTPSPAMSLYEQLAPGDKNRQMILLFHYSERCNICLNMEKYTSEVLNENYPDLVAGKKIQFKLITMDRSDNQNLVERFGLLSATIVLVEFENGQEKRIKVLKDLWEYSQEEVVYKNMLKKELDQFLNNRNE
jgi:hypothetical protein